MTGPLLKPSRLERDVAKHAKVLERRKTTRAEQRKAAAEWRVLSDLVRVRDKGRCRVCRLPTLKLGGDPKRLGAAHHIWYRSAGGKDTTDNLLWLCAQCHDDEHQHRIQLSGDADVIVHLERVNVYGVTQLPCPS